MGPASPSPMDGYPPSDSESSRWGTGTRGRYQIIARPAGYAITNDVIIEDELGRSYLLTQDSEEPVPLAIDVMNSLGMFFEPCQNSSWHTAIDLHRMIYGQSIPRNITLRR